MTANEMREQRRKLIVRSLAWGLAVAVWTAGLLTTAPAHVGKGIVPLEGYLPLSKLLHVAAYAFLALTLAWIPLGRWHWLLLAFLSLHAAGTEYLQQFVPGRTGQISDVVIDHIGLLVGLVLTWKAGLIRT